MKVKSFEAHVKSGGDDGDGDFEAIVSVFNNVDSVGDVVMPGAFADTLKSWADSGLKIPVIWSHQWTDPESNIGEVADVKELLPGDPLLPDHLKALGGLYVRGVYDNDPKAQKVRRLLRGGRVKNFSFAYDIADGAAAERDGRPVYELRKLDLIEVGPTLVGANRETHLVGAKAGKVLSTKNVDRLDEARSLIAEVLSDASAEEPKAAADKEPVTHPDVKSHPVSPRLDPLAVLTNLLDFGDTE